MAGRLRQLREATGLTAKEVAEKCGVSFSMIYQSEYGLRKPSVELGKKLSEIYKCTLDDIFLD